MGKDPKEISIHKGEIIEEMKGEMKGGVLFERKNSNGNERGIATKKPRLQDVIEVIK